MCVTLDNGEKAGGRPAAPAPKGLSQGMHGHILSCLCVCAWTSMCDWQQVKFSTYTVLQQKLFSPPRSSHLQRANAPFTPFYYFRTLNKREKWGVRTGQQNSCCMEKLEGVTLGLHSKIHIYYKIKPKLKTSRELTVITNLVVPKRASKKSVTYFFWLTYSFELNTYISCAKQLNNKVNQKFRFIRTFKNISYLNDLTIFLIFNCITVHKVSKMHLDNIMKCCTILEPFPYKSHLFYWYFT